MPKTRFVLLLALVIAAAGATVWIGWAAARAHQLNGQTMMAMLPLVMLATLAWRRLNGDRD